MHLPDTIMESGEARPTSIPVGSPPSPAAPTAENDEERVNLIAVLREHHGNISAIARATGKARVQVRRLLCWGCGHVVLP